MTSNFRTLWTLCFIDVYPLIFRAVYMIYEEQKNKPQTKTSKETKQIVASIKRNNIINSFEI